MASKKYKRRVVDVDPGDPSGDYSLYYHPVAFDEFLDAEWIDHGMVPGNNGGSPADHTGVVGEDNAPTPTRERGIDVEPDTETPYVDDRNR